ncbi:sugar ABC transporter permease [Paenibacillus pectinilyticus]|uniref:Sugar ABC transporter permease n=1 Tax=Paenibacillus pectinilyticus TaxID=512399 RepID=A0A1C0ZTZ4_9BACL|nr:sugar ABC transporter permease [Paenibacillus pectinilyticus]
MRVPRRRSKAFLKDNWILLSLALPAIVYFLIFQYWPMFGLVIAFKDYSYVKGILGSDWVGFKNFEFFFKSQDFWRLTRNTLGYGIGFIVVGNIFYMGAALLLYEIRSKLALKYYQTTMMFPYFLSWVLISYITYTLFQPEKGVVTQIADFLSGHSIDLYAHPAYWPFILTFTNIWRYIGFYSLIYYAALISIDPEIYEAAKIDGASRWQQSWHISMPSLMPVLSILVLLAIGDIFRGEFGLFYQIPRDVGTLYRTTDVIDTYVFRGLRSGDFSIGTAVGLIQSVVGLFFFLFVNKAIKKINADHSLF